MNQPLRMVCPAVAVFALAALIASNGHVAVAQGRIGQLANESSPGLAALASAAQQGRYSFVFFWKENDAQTQQMHRVFQSGTARMADAADALNVSVTDPREQPMVEKFGVDRAPMPLVLAVAPNGAVTKAWPAQFSEQQLQEGIVSLGTAQCMKALQDNKIVLLCIQNAQTAYSNAAWQVAQEFKADPRFTTATETIALDPADPREAALLHDLEVSSATPEAVTVVLAPPGRPIARFVGVVSKDEIVAKFTAAQSECCPGGQCGPKH